MGTTKIEWCEKSWNVMSGCTKISPGCLNCYAERMAKRLAGRFGYPPRFAGPFAVTLHPGRLDEPLRWKKPTRIFVASMGDLFHDDVPFKYIAQVWDTMFDAPQHTFMILTKRPERMLEFSEWMRSQQQRRIDYENIMVGVTAENQEMADRRIPVLMQIPAAKRFISVEPMLGGVSLHTIPQSTTKPSGYYDLTYFGGPGLFDYQSSRIADAHLDLVICGGETGPGARPMDLEWARSLMKECKESVTPFFFKKVGGKRETPDDLMVREWPD